MPVNDEFTLSWWPIYSFDANDRRDRKFTKLEREGRYAFCVNNMSPFETKKINEWIQRNCEDFSYITKIDRCDHYHDLIGSFYAPSRSIWLSKEKLPLFHTFLQSLPRRTNEFRCGVIDPMVKKMLRGLNYCIFTGMKDDPDRRPLNSILSIENYDNIEQLKFLLAITR